MFRHLFMIFFQPRRTIARILEEQNGAQSWGATWFLIGVNVLMAFLAGVYVFRHINEWMALDPAAGYVPDGVMLAIFAIAMAVTVLWLVAYYLLSRFVFGWFVVLGVKISAGGRYPVEAAERRERARLVRLIQPYTAWMSTLPSVLAMLLLPLFFDLNQFVEAIAVAELDGGGSIPDSYLVIFFGLIGYLLVFGLLSFGLYVYSIIVRVMAIKRIYNLSAAQAFWGPFLIYALARILYYVVYFLFALLSAIFGDVSQSNDLPHI